MRLPPGPDALVCVLAQTGLGFPAAIQAPFNGNIGGLKGAVELDCAADTLEWAHALVLDLAPFAGRRKGGAASLKDGRRPLCSR